MLLTKQAGVSQEKVTVYCSQLDWYKLGESVAKNQLKAMNMKTVFYLLRLPYVSSEMALEFIQGLGWDNLRQRAQEVFNIDVLAACRDVLQLKCRCESQALRRRGIDFDDSDLWRRSLFQPISAITVALKHRCRDAERLLESRRADEVLRLLGSLKDLNILIRNLEYISPTWLVQEMEPHLRTWDAEKWQDLVDRADLLNLGTFLHRFGGRDGLFQWPLPAGLRFQLHDKIRESTLLDLAHLLFSFLCVRCPEESRALALHLEAEEGYVLEQLGKATLAVNEFFFWNYWLAVPPQYEAKLFRLPGLPESLLPKLGIKFHYAAQELGLAGSWRIAGAPGLDAIKRRLPPIDSLHICRELSAQQSPKLIRSLIGLSLVCPELVDADRRLFAEGLDSIVVPGLNIPGQDRAMVYLEDWLKVR